MCDSCKTVLKGYKIKHEKTTCPLLQISYCGLCSKRGHYTIDCPDDIVLENRVPIFLEQLIPSSFIDVYGITSQTKLPQKLLEEKKRHTPLLEVSRKAEHIRAILTEYGRPCKVNGKDATDENMIQLERLAHELGRKLVYREDQVKKIEAYRATLVSRKAK